MKSKVIRAFTCVNTRVRYNIGDTYEADTNRINQLVSKGYVKAEVAHIPKSEVPAPSRVFTHADLAELPQSPKPSKRKRNESK